MSDKELWKIVIGFGNSYLISNHGVLYACTRKDINGRDRFVCGVKAV